MKQARAIATIVLFFFSASSGAGELPYTVDSTMPLAGGCPQPNRWNLSLAAPLDRRWSTALPALQLSTMLTVAAQNTPAQIIEIGQAITASFSAWSGVTGTTFNTSGVPRAAGASGASGGGEFVHGRCGRQC